MVTERPPCPDSDDPTGAIGILSTLHHLGHLERLSKLTIGPVVVELDRSPEYRRDRESVDSVAVARARASALFAPPTEPDDSEL